MKTLILAALLCASPALASGPAHCTDAAGPREAVLKKDGAQWIALNAAQWRFLEGIYAMHPDTPAGLPLGDGAILARTAGDTGGVIFFTDGARICSPMPIPHELIDMLNHVGAGEVYHDESAL